MLGVGVVWTGAESARSEEAAPAAHTRRDIEKYELLIASQPLNTALQEFARQSGIQIVFFSKLTEGQHSPALEGEYTIEAAMEALLSSSKLTFRVLNPRTLQIAERSDSTGERKESTASAPSATPNRKLDTDHNAARSNPLEEVVISTAEGLVATRIETPIREIPQTVEIISHEQIRQQNDTDLADALANAPGITVVRTDSLDADFYARGFKITSYHIDGGAPLFTVKGVDNSGSRAQPGVPFLGTPDLSEFDHIEVLRGADGLFGGNGNPGATVSLVRKRPLDTSQLVLDARTGSWSNNRVEVDANGPLAFDGALRGRMDGTYTDKNYFYDTATFRRRRLFAVLDGDLSPSTVLTLGGSYQWDNAVPFVNGLPRNSDASDPHLPRSTALTFNWSRYQTWTREIYFQAREDISDGWKLRFDATSWNGGVQYAYGYLNNPIDPATQQLTGVVAQTSNRPNTQRQYALDLTLTGSHNWFGHREELAIGGDFTRAIDHLSFDYFASPQSVTIPVRDYDPAAFPDPRTTLQPVFAADLLASERRSGLFASLRAYFTPGFSVVGGARLSDNRNDTSVTLAVGSTSASAQAHFGNTRVLTPYFSAMYDLTDQLSIYGSYADIFRSAGFGPSGQQLKPEHGVDFEVGLKGSWRDQSLNGSLVLYRIEQYSIEIGSANPLLPSSFSFGINTSEGVDLELNGRLQPGWLIGSGYTYNINQSALGGSLSNWTPRHLLKLWTSRELPGVLRRWSVGGDLQAQSGNATTGSFCPLVLGNGICTTDYQDFKVRQGPYAVLGLRAGYQIDSHWRAALSINNVFDRFYYQSLGTPQNSNWYGEPRNFLLRIDGHY